MPDLAVGGQAVIEGVMMRSDDRIATAVRIPSGEILVKSEEYKPFASRYKFLKIPIIRGIITFFEMLIIGIRTLNFSADIAVREVEKEKAESEGKEYTHSEKSTSSFVLVGTAAIAVTIGIVVFFFIPLAISTFFGFEKDAVTFNFLAGLIRVTLFIGYVWGISHFSEFKKVFQYHGAEHKSIFAFENGEDLTTDNVQRYPRLHPRCGTSFILIVALFAILVYAISDSVYFLTVGEAPNLWQRFALHFSLLPVVAGTSYELLKLSGKTRDNAITKFLIKPGLWIQKITTKEPSPAQMEVAIVALESALGMSDSRLSVKKTCL